ncbi:hypothetical protein Slin15195_G097760 [Septoria linicola]|uniref:Uncharacterized protein n=1 Tax=Septoria linicola TaxID=215465 RepID=A0A9Q9B2Y9_9PEZI|nr:hypothetical protein Slin14017_G060820 [Septoria linicola]USW56457.1 hypothetical protein Slin15195_G097760 [Septoria linicola]
MKAAFALAAAGVAVAQGTYPASCPAPGETGADGRYSCNPAHSYPEGQICQEDGGCYYLRVEGPGVYATPSATVSVPEYRTTSACPAPGSNGPDGRYSCNPAHSYPEGQICQEDGGCYYLRTEGPGVYATPSVSLDTPEYRTSTVSAITTYCPSSTVITHEQKTYTVTSATTLTLPCPGGCVVTTPVAPPKTPETHPATQPKVPATTPVAPPKAPETHPAQPPATTPVVYKPTTMAPVPSVPASRNGTQTHSVATYTGAAAQQTAGAILAVAAMGALFL